MVVTARGWPIRKSVHWWVLKELIYVEILKEELASSGLTKHRSVIDETLHANEPLKNTSPSWPTPGPAAFFQTGLGITQEAYKKCRFLWLCL